MLDLYGVDANSSFDPRGVVSDRIESVSVKKFSFNKDKVVLEAKRDASSSIDDGKQTIRFELATDADFGDIVDTAVAKSPKASVAARAKFVDLDPGTEYFFRAIAENGDVETGSFTTQPLSGASQSAADVFHFAPASATAAMVGDAAFGMMSLSAPETGEGAATDDDAMVDAAMFAFMNDDDLLTF